MRILISLAALAAFAPASVGQLTDLQPGRNFQTASAQFGAGRSENVDVGDIDRDGDYDVLVANGGDGAAQANRLYVNNGGLQGGSAGTFTDATGARLAGVTTDTSRDCEFADFDNDCDLDIYISNRGNTINNGEVSRAYTNNGGFQGGVIGFFTENTFDFWGDLVSVPLADETGVQDNHGPWRDFSCDCDFADFDDDGDLDLFHSTYGPNIAGNRDSRIFLNDGNGTFNEMWPWANAGADLKVHTLDMDLVDFDGDLDHDIVMSSRNSQARIYRNNFSQNGWTSGDRFTDVTQSALIATGATVMGGDSNYEGEIGDLDGDGDFDIWMKNYNGFADRLLRNNGDMTFTRFSSWHKGDPNVDENEIDLLDYDSDGDLDAFTANFSGTNWIYQGGVAQGLSLAQGLYHRTGTTAGGSLAPWAETPSSGNGQTTLDGECADMDNDGDPDILLANDGNVQNRYWQNVLGVPDTHAPTFEFSTVQGNKSGNSETVVHVQVRDNAPYYIVDYYEAEISYTLNGGPPTRTKMFAQRGQQFRGVLPAENGTFSYTYRVTDDNGNTGISGPFVYTHSGVTVPSLWQSIDNGTAGDRGAPYLTLGGTQGVSSVLTFKVVDTQPNSLMLLWLSLASAPLSVFGGTLHAFPFSGEFLIATDSGGMLAVQTFYPGGVPTGTMAWWQCLVEDATNPFGITLTNAVKSTAP